MAKIGIELICIVNIVSPSNHVGQPPHITDDGIVENL